MWIVVAGLVLLAVALALALRWAHSVERRLAALAARPAAAPECEDPEPAVLPFPREAVKGVRVIVCDPDEVGVDKPDYH